MNKRLKEAIHRQALWKAYNGKCFYCDNFIPTILQLEEEHIIPQTYKDKPEEMEKLIEDYGLWSDFDIDAYYNRVPSEKGCNRKKSFKLHNKVSIHFYLNTAKDKVESVKSIEEILERKAKANDDLFKTGFTKESLEKFLNLIEEDDPQMPFLRAIFIEWVCFKYKPEDGLDYLITILENELEKPNFFFVRLKTDSIDVSDENINFGNINVEKLNFYLGLNTPVIFILCDDQSQKAYWVNIHRYCYEELDINEPDWRLQEQVKVMLPKVNELIDKNVIKEEITNYIKIMLRKITDSYSWRDGYDDILFNAEKFKKKLKKDELNLIRGKFQQSLLEFRQANLEGMREQYLEIYSMKRKDKEHLKAILAILMTGEQYLFFRQAILISYAQEGLVLARDLGEELYINIFSFFLKYFELFNWSFQKLYLKLVKSTYQRNQIQIDETAEQMRNLQENSVEQKITQLEIEINEIMDCVLEGKHIFEHMQLLLIYIRMDLIVANALRQSGESEFIRENYSCKEEFFIRLLHLIESLGDVELQLNSKRIIGGCFEQFNPEKARDIYNSGLELAQELNHMFYIEKFTLIFSELGQEDPPIDMNTPLSQVINKFKTNKQLLTDALGPQMLEIFNNALRDIDPLPILKHCKNFVVGYYPKPVMFFGLYSEGTKRLGCSKRYLYSEESDNLSALMLNFIRNNCRTCEFREPQDDQFDPPFKIIDEMLNFMRNRERT